jgi:hypothetical protein
VTPAGNEKVSLRLIPADINEFRSNPCYKGAMNFSMKNDSILARALKGLAVAITSLVVFGTVAALWENPLFVRMTPAGSFEIVLLTLLSVLLGIYVGIRRPFCSLRGNPQAVLFGENGDCERNCGIYRDRLPRLQQGPFAAVWRLPAPAFSWQLRRLCTNGCF